MAELIKFGHVKGGFEYEIGKSNDNLFSEVSNTLSYLDSTGVNTDIYIIRRVKDRNENLLSENSDIVSIHTIDPALYCRVHGDVKEPNGKPVGNAIVESNVHPLDEPEIHDDDSHSNAHLNDVTFTADTGKFDVYLRRQKRFIVKIPAIQFELWFEVPDEADKNLQDLVGTPLEIKNPY